MQIRSFSEGSLILPSLGLLCFALQSSQVPSPHTLLLQLFPAPFLILNHLMENIQGYLIRRGREGFSYFMGIRNKSSLL